MKKIIIILLLSLTMFFAGYKFSIAKAEQSLEVEEKNQNQTIEQIDIQSLSKYEGLDRVELYNAVMTTAYTGDVREVDRTINKHGEVVKTVIRSGGNVYESYKKSDEKEYIMIYVANEKKLYDFITGGKIGNVTSYNAGIIGYDRGFYSITDELADFLLASEIIEYNGRLTYYVELVFEIETGESLAKYWYDLQTKTLMKSENYINDELISESEIIEFDVNYDIPPDQFKIPQDIEFRNIINKTK